MATLVSTGQITIVDNNDARSITAFLTSSAGTQQVYSKDESSVAYTPSWFTAALTLTAKVYVGGLSEAQSWAGLTNKKFALTQGGAALTSASTSTSFVNNADAAVSTPFTVTHAADGSSSPSTFAIAGNLKDTVASFVVFFEADFTDPITGLVTHVVAQITLNTVKTGSNAVFITTRGSNVIQGATGTVKNVIAIAADLVRAGGIIDTSGLTYKWYQAGGSTQISTSVSGYATKFGLKTTTSGTSPTGANSDLGTNVPASGSGNAYNTLVISEDAVVDIGIFKVDITDADSKTYSQYFTVFDSSDPYDVRINSSAGDKLQNGIGSTNLTPQVFYGANQVADLTGWSFTWYFYDRNGKRGAFVDTAKISAAGGANITANTTGASAQFTYDGASYAFTAGMIIKCVKPNGQASFYEVASAGTNTVTIRAPSTNTWLTFTDFPAPSASTDFVGGKIFGCTTGGSRTSSGAAAITVTGDEIDVKGSIYCEANRP